MVIAKIYEILSSLILYTFRSNAAEIVLEMLSYLETADYSIREEMVSIFRISRFVSDQYLNILVSVLLSNAYFVLPGIESCNFG